MTLNPGGRRLRQWLIEQVQSNQYPGLLWEDESRTMFRIPWKHAGKQDYNQEIDASIFKAWAMFKGKFKEGDKAEPATWKTRLRCALNKSPDFEEVTDRSQLDISEPYKVYRIVPEDEQKSGKNTVATNGSCPADVIEMEGSSVDLEEFMKESSNDDYFGIIKRSHSPAQESSRVPPAQEWWSPEAFCLASSVSSGLSPVGSLDLAHSSMMVSFFYGGKLVGSALSTNAEGCRISLLRPPAAGEPPGGPDSLQNVAFPPIEVIENERQRHVTRKLFAHLDRGVLVRANREGIFIKRLCQSRVFWSGLTSQYGSVSNKLERDAVVKIFDTGRFLQALQLYQDCHYPAPDPMITLCFGEEYPDVSTSKNKLIIVQITLMSCQQQLDVVNSQRFSSGNLEITDNVQGDQIAHVFQDLCGYVVSQRTFRENLPIAI